MAANLTAVFELVDRISDKLDAIANKGDTMVSNWEDAGTAIDQSFDRAISAADEASAAIDNYNQSISEAAAQTEEFGEQGIRSAEALERQTDILAQCDQAAQELSEAIEKTYNAQKDCSAAMEKANKIAEKVAGNDKVSAKAKEELEKATERATRAFEDLEAVQTEAQSAMEEYDAILSSEAANLDEIQEASDRAAQAAERLRNAQENAADAASELSEATQNAADEAENAGKKGGEAIKQLQSAMAAAGIVGTVKAAGEALLDASEAASQAETAFAKLQTIAGAGAMGTLTKEVKELSADTGIAQGVLADVAYNAISAGSAVENAVDTAGAAAKLAAAGFTETSSALSVLSTAMNSYGDTAGTATDISNSLIMVQNLGVTTVAELAASMGKSISTAAAYNVSLGNLESAYVSVTKAGINTAEATTYISGMLSELGKEGSTVATILQERTGQSFGQLMSSGYTLADVLDIIYDAAGNDAEAMMNLWSSQTAGVASAAIVNQGLEQFNENLIAIEESAGATESAYSVMANTTEHAQEKMNNSAENLKIAIGSSLNPALEKLYSIGASAFQWAANFAEEHPVVVKAITAVAVGVGVVAVAVAGFVFVTQVAIPALTSFGTALNAALGPIGWVALAITGIVAAGTALVAMLSDTEDETANMTAITKQQYYELQDLNAEYERACEVYGENSEEALRLQYQIDDLSEAFENNRQTLEEFQAEVDDLCNSVNDLWTEFDKNISEINANETGTLALIQKYEDLAEKAELTAGEQKQLEAVTRSLADQFPDLAAKVDAATLSTEDYIEALKKSAQADADKQRQQEAQSAYVEALKKQAELEEEIAKAEENLRLEKEAFNSVEWEWWSDQAFYQATGWDPFNTNNIDEYQAALDELKAAQEENNAEVAKLESNFEALAEKEQKAAEEAISYEDACAGALESVKERVDELCVAYDEAYQSALDSFQGQFGLFDEASMKSEDYLNATVANAQAALDSQVAYWEEYNANLETLTAYGEGLTGEARENYEQLLTYAQSGNEEAAGLAASIADAINSGNDDAVNKLSETVGKVAAQQEAAAAKTAEFKTNFNEEMEDILSDMGEYVSKLGFEDEATKAAASTMISYAQSIRQGKNEAIQAASEVADAVSAAIRGSVISTNINISQSASVPGHARGTTNAEDVFIAGESGPELIVGAGGSTVFPHSETDRIIDAISEPAEQSVKVVNEYEPTSFIDKIENFFTRLIGKFSSVFDGAARGNAVELEAYATGTTASDKNFIAGENGPELILNQPDSTVFPSDETDRLINAIDATYNRDTEQGANYDYPVPAATNTEHSDGLFVPVGNNWNAAEGNSGNSDTNTKKITLEIAGKGNIELSGGKPDKESLLAFLYEYLKPVLSDIISEEVYEEGDLSYEY